MNPMTNVKNVLKLSERELSGQSKSSWHDQYRDSAWLFIGGLPYDLTEGDIICVFSQYGEVVNINLVRDKATGKSKGFAFLCYEDQRSTILAVDNLNGIKVLGRVVRVDHCAQYRAPGADHAPDHHAAGCAPAPAAPAPAAPVVAPAPAAEKLRSKRSKHSKTKKKKKKSSKSSGSDSSSGDGRY